MYHSSLVEIGQDGAKLCRFLKCYGRTAGRQMDPFISPLLGWARQIPYHYQKKEENTMGLSAVITFKINTQYECFFRI